MPYTRITVDSDQMGGVPCIRGLRIPVATVVAMIADRMSEQEILEAYPDLETEDIRQALHFAAQAVQERELPLAIGRSTVGLSEEGSKARIYTTPTGRPTLAVT